MLSFSLAHFTRSWLARTGGPLLGFFVAWSALAHGDLHERIKLLTHQLGAEPTNAVLVLQRAELRRQHGELDAALADVEEAARMRPGWTPALVERARVLFALGEFISAREAADAALRLQAGHFDALRIRSRCLAKTGRTNEAIAGFTLLLSGKGPKTPDLYLERARLQAGSGELAAAAKGLDEGIRKLGNTPSLSLQALSYERQAGEYDAALVRLETARRFVPHDSLLVLRGEVLAEAGCLGEAEASFAEALTLMTNSAASGPRLQAHVKELEARMAEALQKAQPNIAAPLSKP